jgi:TetR/AcrR family transcriptional regulator, cholesterol catabolism regulator
MANGSPARKNIILKEAAKLFREKGYHASNLRELARRAGIQGGSIYHHFASKQEILFQLMDHTMSDMTERLTAILAPLESSTERLRQTMRFHIEYHIVGPDETYITDEELRNLEPDNYLQIIAKRDRYQRLFEEILVRGKEQQNWQIGDIKLFARGIIQLCAGVTRWYKPHGTFTIDQIAAHYFALLCSGLEVR